MTTNPIPGCIRVTFPLRTSDFSLINTLQMGLCLSDCAKKNGGRAKCFRTSNAIIVEMKGVNMELVDSFCGAMANSNWSISAKLNMLTEERESPEIDLDNSRILPGEYEKTKLTKKLVNELPTGAIVVSNCYRKGKPILVFQVDEEVSRADYWEGAVESGAAQRICDVHWNRKDVEELYGLDLADWYVEDEEPPSEQADLRL